MMVIGVVIVVDGVIDDNVGGYDWDSKGKGFLIL